MCASRELHSATGPWVSGEDVGGPASCRRDDQVVSAIQTARAGHGACRYAILPGGEIDWAPPSQKVQGRSVQTLEIHPVTSYADTKAIRRVGGAARNHPAHGLAISRGFTLPGLLVSVVPCFSIKVLPATSFSLRSRGCVCLNDCKTCLSVNRTDLTISLRLTLALADDKGSGHSCRPWVGELPAYAQT